MIITKKIKLMPNNKQLSKLFACAGVARWAYNYALNRIQKEYNATGKFITHYEIRKELTQKKKIEYPWLYGYSNNITKIAINDAAESYIRFFKKQCKYPKFKNRFTSKKSFGHDPIKLKGCGYMAQIEKIGKIQTCEIIPQVKYHNPRIGYDGLNWWITFGIDIEPVSLAEKTKPIGIDLGVKDLAIISTGEIIPNINKTLKMIRLEKRLRRKQRAFAKLKLKNKQKGGKQETNKAIKLKTEVLKTYRRMGNIRTNHIHQATIKIVKSNPKYIVLEDLNINGMLKNHCLANAIQQQMLSEFRRQIEYKSLLYMVEVIIANRFFPSSQICSCCGSRQKMILSERIYNCHCGAQMDRDLNAAINLRNYLPMR